MAKRVIVVESDVGARVALRSMIESFGLACDDFEDVVDASTASTIDLLAIIAEVDRSDSKALDWKCNSDESRSSIPTIGVLACNDLQLKSRCLEAGMRDIMVKPLHKDALYESLSSLDSVVQDSPSNCDISFESGRIGDQDPFSLEPCRGYNAALMMLLHCDDVFKCEFCKDSELLSKGRDVSSAFSLSQSTPVRRRRATLVAYMESLSISTNYP